jgi:hypothetical protein
VTSQQQQHLGAEKAANAFSLSQSLWPNAVSKRKAK